MSNVTAIVQARMGSNRLPGKSLAKVYKDISLLEIVLLRVLRAEMIDSVVLATSAESNCDRLEEIASGLGVKTIRGSEEDVLSRFVQAIRLSNAQTVVRVCADNPLIDPGEIDKLAVFFDKNNFDYAANNTPECGLPDGLGCEIVKSEILLYIAKKTKEPSFREHVTSYIKAHSDQFSLGWLKTEKDLWWPELKLDIDTQADLEKMRKFCSSLPKENPPYWTACEIVMSAKSMIQA